MNPVLKPQISHPDVLVQRVGLAQMRRSRGTLAETAQRFGTMALAWMHRLFPSADRERDAYLAGATDQIDLERRIRNWERRPNSFWGGI